MREPPDIPADRITEAARRHYGLAAAALEYLPLGLDVAAWAFRLTATGGRDYFVKLRSSAPRQATLLVPRYLADRGADCVVSPLRGLDGTLSYPLDRVTLALYPYIDGETAKAHGLQEKHWRAYGAALRALHNTPLSPDIEPLVPADTLSPSLADDIRELDKRIASGPPADPIEEELHAGWRERLDSIQQLCDRFERLSADLRASPPPLVLCHADIHPNNVLIDTDDRLWLVDWDDVMLAPKEADLMMGIGGLGSYPAGPTEARWFLQGYGSNDVNPVALAYYRHVRALGDIAYDAVQVIDLAASDTARRTALRNLQSLFEPGRIVDLAAEATSP